MALGLVNVQVKQADDFNHFPLTYSDISAVSKPDCIYSTNSDTYPIVIVFNVQDGNPASDNTYTNMVALVIKNDPTVNNGYYLHDYVFLGADDGGLYYSYQDALRTILKGLRYRISERVKIKLANFQPKFSSHYRP